MGHFHLSCSNIDVYQTTLINKKTKIFKRVWSEVSLKSVHMNEIYKSYENNESFYKKNQIKKYVINEWMKHHRERQKKNTLQTESSGVNVWSDGFAIFIYTESHMVYSLIPRGVWELTTSFNYTIRSCKRVGWKYKE